MLHLVSAPEAGVQGYSVSVSVSIFPSAVRYCAHCKMVQPLLWFCWIKE